MASSSSTDAALSLQQLAAPSSTSSAVAGNSEAQLELKRLLALQDPGDKYISRRYIYTRQHDGMLQVSPNPLYPPNPNESGPVVNFTIHPIDPLTVGDEVIVKGISHVYTKEHLLIVRGGTPASSSPLTRTTGHSRCGPVGCHDTEPAWIPKLIDAAQRGDTAWIDKHLELYISMEQRITLTPESKQKVIQQGLFGRAHELFNKVKRLAKQDPPADMAFGEAPHVIIVWSHSLDREKGTIVFKVNQSRLMNHSVRIASQLQRRQVEHAGEELTYHCVEQLRYHHIVRYLQFIALDYFGNPHANAIITEFNASVLFAATYFKDAMTCGIVINWAHMHLQSMDMELLTALTHVKGDWLHQVFDGWSLRRIAHALDNTLNLEKGFGLLWKEVLDRVLGAEKPSKDEQELGRIDKAFELDTSPEPPPAKRQKTSPVPVPLIINVYHIDTEQHIGECLHCKERVRVALGLTQSATVGWGHIRQFLSRQDAPAAAPVVAELAASSAPHPRTEQHIILCTQCCSRVRRELGLHGNTTVNPVHVREYMVKQKGSSGVVAPPQP